METPEPDSTVSLTLHGIHDVEFCPGCKTWWVSFGDMEHAPRAAGVARLAIGDNGILARALGVSPEFKPTLCTPCSDKVEEVGTR